MLQGIPTTGGVGLKDALDFIPHAAENFEFGCIRPGSLRRIVEAPMMPVDLAWKHRTRLVRIAADRDDRFHFLREKFVQMFRVMLGNIQADFPHHLNRERMHVARRIRAGALDVEAVSERVAQNSLREMAATGVAGAKNQNERFVRRHKI